MLSDPTRPPRILLIDSYDSFTHNLAALCRKCIPNCSVHIIRNDQLSLSNLVEVIPYFSAIIVGPGPGSPEINEDIGVVKHIWTLSDQVTIPVFGVCLGLQSLAVEHGAVLRRLNVVKHGQISSIIHADIDIFEGSGAIEAVRYHSLYVILKDGGNIEPLAWADDGEENGRVVMAVKHANKPLWAVQYHPESVRSNSGDHVLRNFWRLAEDWSNLNHRHVRTWSSLVEEMVGPAWPNLRPYPSAPLDSTPIPRLVHTKVIDSLVVPVTRLCEELGVANEQSDFVLLDSAAQPGRFSIIGCISPTTNRFTYHVGTDYVVADTPNGSPMLIGLGSKDIWTWISSYMRAYKSEGGIDAVPFWGGLIGYLSYELGVDSLLQPSNQHSTTNPDSRHPDLNLLFIERSIVIDSLTSKVYVQSIIHDDDAWLEKMVVQLQGLETASPITVPLQPSDVKLPHRPITVTFPDKDAYIARIKDTKEYLFSGDSYELCFTAPTKISVPKTPESGCTSWNLFKTLRKRNPAPHAAYLRLGPSTLVCSSPERFLSYSRSPNTLCQLRPIKGTVRKAPGITRAMAEEALVGSPKEVAENLMIVDLIRHDLHGVIGEDVEVKKFCGVEEYKTVWQLVSVIEGRPDPATENPDAHLGWEVLKHSFPPGSMTGAPKKRSVEILQNLEGQPRGIYSGVLGYWCVGGGGDWSVTIRTCFKYDAARQTEADAAKDEWVLGAGGAITALSDPEAEWDEMLAKVESVLRAFQEPEP